MKSEVKRNEEGRGIEKCGEIRRDEETRVIVTNEK